jgi:hypothetical protein
MAIGDLVVLGGRSEALIATHSTLVSPRHDRGNYLLSASPLFPLVVKAVSRASADAQLALNPHIAAAVVKDRP